MSPMKGPLVVLLACGLHSLTAAETRSNFFGIPVGKSPGATAGEPATKNPEAQNAAALPPELLTIRESIYKGEQVMRDIFDKKMENFRAAFFKAIDDAAAKAEVSLKQAVTNFLRKRLGELKRGEGPIVLTFQPGDPPEWQALVKSGRQSLEIWQQQYEEQATKLTAVFRQQLKEASESFTKKKQPEDAGLAARMALGLPVWLSLRGRIWASDLEKTTLFGGSGGGRFQHVPGEGGVLTGFRYTEKNYSGHPIIGSLTPVYLTPQGEVDGPTFGRADAPVKSVMAREGYAVAGIIPVSGHRLDGFSVVFMRIKDNEPALDPKSRYVSEHVGGRGGGKANASCGDDGRLVVGICGRSGGDVDSAGLILLGKSK
jgi:hypothetical protein